MPDDPIPAKNSHQADNQRFMFAPTENTTSENIEYKEIAENAPAFFGTGTEVTS